MSPQCEVAVRSKIVLRSFSVPCFLVGCFTQLFGRYKLGTSVCSIKLAEFVRGELICALMVTFMKNRGAPTHPSLDYYVEITNRG